MSSTETPRSDRPSGLCKGDANKADKYVAGWKGDKRWLCEAASDSGTGPGGHPDPQPPLCRSSRLPRGPSDGLSPAPHPCGFAAGESAQSLHCKTPGNPAGAEEKSQTTTGCCQRMQQPAPSRNVPGVGTPTAATSPGLLGSAGSDRSAAMEPSGANAVPAEPSAARLPLCAFQ